MLTHLLTVLVAIFGVVAKGINSSSNLVIGPIDLGNSDVKLKFAFFEDEKKVRFEIDSKKVAWIGFGLAGSSGGMTGADVVVGYGSGNVQRYVIIIDFRG